MSRRDGRVVYAAAEGLGGFKLRISAWLDFHRWRAEDLAGFKLVPMPVPLGDLSAVTEFIKTLKGAFPGENIDLVVLDTQARCTEGLDENLARDMGLAVGQVDRIKRETGATVLLLHHSGYDGSHARGSTAVRAALETQAVLQGSRQVLTLNCEKQKDWEPFEPIRLALLPWADSLVVVAEDEPASRLPVAATRLTPNQRKAYNVLREHPGGLRANEWEAASGLAHSSFHAAREALCKTRLVEHREDLYLAVHVESRQSSSDESKSDGACSGEVQRSTTPLGGGPVDSDASGDEGHVEPAVEDAWEESRDAPR